MLSSEVLTSIKKITGLSFSDMQKMDIYCETKYIQDKTGKKLTFPSTLDARRMGRGNPLIARRRFRTIEEVDKRMSNIKWK